MNPLTQRRSARKDAPTSHFQAYTKFKNCLKQMLMDMVTYAKENPEVVVHPILSSGPHKNVVERFQSQVLAFWNEEYPFDARGMTLSHSEASLQWWERLSSNPMADVLSMLACKIFSVLVNSMPDERTNSAVTWLNSPIRGCQDASTVIDMITIKQWYERQNYPGGLKPERYRPVVKFRKLDAETLEKLRGQQVASSQAQAAEGEDEEGVGSSEDNDSDDSDGFTSGLANIDPTSCSPPPWTLHIDPCIDLHSKALRDLVSTHPVVGEDEKPMEPLDDEPRLVGGEAGDEEIDWNF